MGVTTGRRPDSQLTLFICHQGEWSQPRTNAQYGNASQLVSVDLEAIELPSEWVDLGPRLAEVRAFLAHPPESIATSHVGFVSWRLPEKFGHGMSIEGYYRSAKRRLPYQVSGPMLWRDRWPSLSEQADESFPGMGRLIDRLQIQYPQVVDWGVQVAANSFVVDRELYGKWYEYLLSVLRWPEWRSGSPTFGFRCESCGFTRSDGLGRYSLKPDIALFIEHATIYFFQYQSPAKPRYLWTLPLLRRGAVQQVARVRSRCQLSPGTPGRGWAPPSRASRCSHL